MTLGRMPNTRLRPEWMGLFFVAVPLSLVVGIVLNGRVLGVQLVGLAAEISDFDYVAPNWPTQAIAVVCLAIALERAVRFLLRREYARARGGWLLASLMVYVVVANVISPVLGTRPGFSIHLLYAPLFALAIFAYAQASAEQCVVVTRNAMLAFLLVSLAALAVRFDMVAESNYQIGLVPGFSLRLHGFATHANTLAPLCFVLMICLMLQPFAGRWLTAFGWAVASVCLLLTQSKTSIGLVAVLLGVMLILARLRIVRARKRVDAGTFALFMTGALLSILLLVGVLAAPDLMEKVAPAVDTQQITSLTGRTAIWAATFNAVKVNPLFGYGPSLWDLEFRIKTGMMFTHSHDQYLQTLGTAGIIGLLALTGYLVMLFRTAWRARAGSQGTTIALTLFLLIRGVTEVPLSVSTAMQSEFMVQMFLLVLCVGYLPVSAKLRERETYASVQWIRGRLRRAPEHLVRAPIFDHSVRQ
jgi:exopolysaccharide production protein ExoQ